MRAVWIPLGSCVALGPWSDGQPGWIDGRVRLVLSVLSSVALGRPVAWVGGMVEGVAEARAISGEDCCLWESEAAAELRGRVSGWKEKEEPRMKKKTS